MIYILATLPITKFVINGFSYFVVILKNIVHKDYYIFLVR